MAPTAPASAPSSCRGATRPIWKTCRARCFDELTFVPVDTLDEVLATALREPLVNPWETMRDILTDREGPYVSE